MKGIGCILNADGSFGSFCVHSLNTCESVFGCGESPFHFDASDSAFTNDQNPLCELLGCGPPHDSDFPDTIPIMNFVTPGGPGPGQALFDPLTVPTLCSISGSPGPLPPCPNRVISAEEIGRISCDNARSALFRAQAESKRKSNRNGLVAAGVPAWGALGVSMWAGAGAGLRGLYVGTIAAAGKIAPYVVLGSVAVGFATAAGSRVYYSVTGEELRAHLFAMAACGK